MRDILLSEAIKNAEHYKAVGERELYLCGGPFPWEYVTEVRNGGLHRMDLCVSLQFVARHPCGLSFWWSFDLESKEANGSGYYQFDTSGIANVMTLLPEDILKEFKAILAEDAEIIQKKADSIREVLTRQLHDAALLKGLSLDRPEKRRAERRTNISQRIFSNLL